MPTIINTVERPGRGPKSYNYSEIFGKTIQAEGHFTGRPTVWIRLWGCNFSCNGFGQKDPTDSTTWDLSYENIKVEDYKSMEELPVFSTGCDSSYSWAQKFQHLSHKDTAEGIVNKLRDLLPGRQWAHPKSEQYHHLAFTGGEPMMSQTAIVDIMKQFDEQGESPRYVTIETNGTQMPRPDFVRVMGEWAARPGNELFWSVSPKLYLSGEAWDQAIQPEVVSAYRDISDHGQLKYVSDGADRSWEEVEEATELYREEGIQWDVWIMPVGARKEEQEEHQAAIAEQAVERGYSVAARVHCWIFGNILGK
jgi:organic radical activating enzyme